MSDKIILIISKDADHSTNDIMDWLNYFGFKTVRIGDSNKIESINVKQETNCLDIKFMVDHETISFKNIACVWYRKSFIDIYSRLGQGLFTTNLNEKFKEFLISNELHSLKEFLDFMIETKPHIGNIKKPNANKLISFEIAKKNGLKTPTTHITTKKSTIQKQKKSEYIVKPIQDLFQNHYYEKVSSKYKSACTTITRLSDVKSDLLTEKITPSCIQKEIKKKFEIRTFYLFGKMFSMVIFSQLDKKTSLDFRNLNLEKPTRSSPYNLPTELKTKIHSFMKEMRLNTGSLDFIVNENNEYIFLEVNPSGQFGFIEHYTNHPLNLFVSNEIKKLYETNQQ